MFLLPENGLRRGRRRRRAGAAVATAVATGAAVALLGWVGPSYATTTPAAAKPAAGGTATAAHKAAATTAGQRPARPKPTSVSPTPTGPTAASPTLVSPTPTGPKPGTQPPAKTGSGTKTRTGTQAKPAAPSEAKVKALRAGAAARAVTQAAPRNTQSTDCGGVLALDTVHACTAIPGSGSDTYTVTTTVADDVLAVQLAPTGDASVDATLTGPDGTDISCSVFGASPATCSTGPAGTYTIEVVNWYTTGGYTLAVSSLRSSPCTRLTASDLAFGAGPSTGSLAAGAAASCYALGDGAASGDLLRLGGLSYEVRGTVFDATGTQVCDVGQYGNTCALTGTAPYRMLVRDTYAQAVSYAVTVSRLSHPTGCATLAAAPFGDPGQAVASGTVPIDGTACRTVTLPAGPVAVSLKGGDSTGGSLLWTLYTAQGDVACSDRDDTTCTALPGAGTYTLLLEDTSIFQAADYAIALVPLTGTDGCAPPVGTSYDLPVLHGTLGSPVQVDCRPFDAAPGDRIDLAANADVYAEMITTIIDPTGAPSCSTDTADGSSQDGCVLTGSGPYRAITRGFYDFTGTYSMRIARLSNPAGCTPLAPQAYGTDPAGSPNPCRLLQVPAAGTYDVGGTSVYHLDGTRFCRSDSCTFPAAGTYAMVFRPSFINDQPFQPVFISPTQTAGCVATSDTGFSGGPVTVDLTEAGRRDCLMLPTASGNGVYLAATSSDDGHVPAETVYDAKGVKQCDSDSSFSVCKLTGTAPFHLVLTAPRPGAFGLSVQRTADATGCKAWPQSAFGGSTGTQVGLTARVQTVCLALPAGGHSTAEMFDYTNTANNVNASIRVYDAAGDQVCTTSGSTTTTCRFTAGIGYTAVLVGVSGADTYHIVRRDISSTANCAAPSSLTVGGPSTGYTFGSALDSRCLRVQAAATDKLWLSVRTPTATGKSGAQLFVVDATGTIVCRQYGASCRVSGSTSYVVGVVAFGYAGTPIAAHVDTWRVGTAAGWVPQCTANPLSADGIPLRSGSLTETATAYCGVLQIKARQSVDIYGALADPTAGTPALGMYAPTPWDGTSFDYSYQCIGESGSFHYECTAEGSAPAAQVAFIISPGDARTPIDYTMQGVCHSQCATQTPPAEVTSLSPASGPAGGDNRVVVHGAHLNLGTQVRLERGSVRSDYPATPVSVSADGTALTVLLSTRGLDPGAYDVVLNDVGHTVGTPSTGYLPGAYTVTKAVPPLSGGPAHVTAPPPVFGTPAGRTPPKWKKPA
ncbi:hypothetical protein SAMN05216251_102511 [Actinacidiphila alni]|uniref:Uncharacterized protein n=1 Tax=Actinacidiphila alni TaxID=380248 RepID=A0A1I1ZQY7_9ACTN|nr:hypothetical protein [Actinacidiphila alni]SFE33023.1 hypothetical protein SAMN05216251_102511 [Actinacidiphila alni]